MWNQNIVLAWLIFIFPAAKLPALWNSVPWRHPVQPCCVYPGQIRLTWWFPRKKRKTVNAKLPSELSAFDYGIGHWEDIRAWRGHTEVWVAGEVFSGRGGGFERHQTNGEAELLCTPFVRWPDQWLTCIGIIGVPGYTGGLRSLSSGGSSATVHLKPSQVNSPGVSPVSAVSGQSLPLFHLVKCRRKHVDLSNVYPRKNIKNNKNNT